MIQFQEIASRMPEGLKEQFMALPSSIIREVEEIRLQCGQRILLRCGSRERYIEYLITAKDLQQILHHLIQYSYYAYEEDIARGFITIEGGHRVGICGRAVVKQGQPVLLKEISSMNIRFAKEIRGCSLKILPDIMKEGRICSSLIVSPPGCGKTTLLRDLARALSENRFRVAVCDERSEIAGMYQSRPGFDLGPRCDVLDGCDKSKGIPMLIRSMAPQVIITDEIGKEEDISAVMQCVVSGVSLISSIHGYSMDDLERSAIGPMVKAGIFKRIIFLGKEQGAGTVREVQYCD